MGPGKFPGPIAFLLLDTAGTQRFGNRYFFDGVAVGFCRVRHEANT
jgi:hypothetical protein